MDQHYKQKKAFCFVGDPLTGKPPTINPHIHRPVEKLQWLFKVNAPTDINVQTKTHERAYFFASFSDTYTTMNIHADTYKTSVLALNNHLLLGTHHAGP